MVTLSARKAMCRAVSPELFSLLPRNLQNDARKLFECQLRCSFEVSVTPVLDHRMKGMSISKLPDEIGRNRQPMGDISDFDGIPLHDLGPFREQKIHRESGGFFFKLEYLPTSLRAEFERRSCWVVKGPQTGNIRTPLKPRSPSGVFNSRDKTGVGTECPTTLEFAGHEELHGRQVLVYHFLSPANGCVGNLYGDFAYNAARTGRVFIENPRETPSSR